MNDIHSCSYYCDRPECIKAQRDELRDNIDEQCRLLGMGSEREARLIAKVEELEREVMVLRTRDGYCPQCWMNGMQGEGRPCPIHDKEKA